MPWPASYSSWVCALNLFAFDFKVLNSAPLTAWLTILTGLLLPIWAALALNAARRNNFGGTVYSSRTPRQLVAGAEDPIWTSTIPAFVTLSFTSGWKGFDEYRTGTCYVDGDCFGTGLESNYEGDERCSFTFDDRAAIQAVCRFDTHAGLMGHFFVGGESDALHVGSNRYPGHFSKASGPNNVKVAAGEVVT